MKLEERKAVASLGLLSAVLALYLFFWKLSETFFPLPIHFYARLIEVLALALFVAGVWASDKVARDLGVNDHKSVVVDEVVGIWLLFAFLPQGTLWWIAGFAAFRFFDIVKLPPVDIIDEKLKNGVGVMADDVVAAFYAWVVVSLLGWLFG